MHIQEKDKFSSQFEASDTGKVEGINIISSNFYDDSSNLTTATSLRSGKILDDPVTTTATKQVKSSDDSTQHDKGTTNISLPTYNLFVPYP